MQQWGILRFAMMLRIYVDMSRSLPESNKCLFNFIYIDIYVRVSFGNNLGTFYARKLTFGVLRTQT